MVKTFTKRKGNERGGKKKGRKRDQEKTRELVYRASTSQSVLRATRKSHILS